MTLDLRIALWMVRGFVLENATSPEVRAAAELLLKHYPTEAPEKTAPTRPASPLSWTPPPRAEIPLPLITLPEVTPGPTKRPRRPWTEEVDKKIVFIYQTGVTKPKAIHELLDFGDALPPSVNALTVHMGKLRSQGLLPPSGRKKAAPPTPA